MLSPFRWRTCGASSSASGDCVRSDETGDNQVLTEHSVSRHWLSAGVLSTGRVHLSAATRRNLRVRPTIVQRLEHKWCGFGREHVFLASRKHAFEVCVMRSELDSELEREQALGRSRAYFRRTLRNYLPRSTPGYLGADRLVVAHLFLEESTPAICETHWDGNWRELLTSLADQGDIASRGALRLLDTGPDKTLGIDEPLASGSLFRLFNLGVHPLCRGQGLARALLTHALLAVRRAPGDLVVVEAYPGGTLFDRRAPAITTRTVRRLVRLYERVGLRRLDAEGPIRKEPQILYLQFGRGGLPAPPTDNEIMAVDDASFA